MQRAPAALPVATMLLGCFACSMQATAAIQTFNLIDTAIFFSSPPSDLTITNGQVIPGGFDNSLSGNPFNLSTLGFDIDGDFDPLAPDPIVFIDLQVRTATAVGGQIVFDGFHHQFEENQPTGGAYVVRPFPISQQFYLAPFAPGDLIGDGDDNEQINRGSATPGAFGNSLFNIAVEGSAGAGTLTTFLQPGVDSFFGFILDDGNYGYFRTRWNPDAAGGAGQLSLLDGAYDDSGAPIQVPLASDFNGDGVVDAADYTVWRDNFPTTGGATIAVGDANGDSDVTREDYEAWVDQFGLGVAPEPVPSAESVPEPTSALLAMAAAATLTRPGRWDR